MIDLQQFLDAYDRKARVYPALLCLLPIVLAVSVSLPDSYELLVAIAGIAAGFGGVNLLGHIGRDRGKALESKLYETWQGVPSVAILRLSDTRISEPAKQRYHQILSTRTGIPAIPETPGNRAGSDAVYKSWSDYLRGKTRDKTKYSLVFKELINYGFRRNLYGLKPHALISGVLALLILLVPGIVTGTLGELHIAMSVLVDLYIFTILLLINSKWVKTTADAYAVALIESINI